MTRYSNPEPRTSIVIPVLDDADAVESLLACLAPLRETGAEVVVVDGGSRDDTAERCRGRCDRFLESARGRARQMNAGALAASGDRLWFLHADSQPPPAALTRMAAALQRRPWGRFDVALSGGGWRLRVVAALMNRRSCWTGICTGDQGLFLERWLWERAGGFPDQPLMEDIALSARLRREAGWPACLPGPLVTSSRRWRVYGVWRTVALMWRLRLAYALGADPVALHRRYYGSRPEPPA